MTDLTPERIVDYPLRTGVRGYRVDQVDDLLDRVADRVEELERRLADRDAELERVRAQLQEASTAEDTLSRTLVTAQRAAEETLAEAESEAERITAAARERATEIVGEARREAEGQRHEASRDVDRIHREAEVARRDAELRLTQLTGAAERFRAQLQDHLDAHQALLDQVPRADDLPDPPEPRDATDRATTADGPGPFPDSATPLFSSVHREGSADAEGGTDESAVGNSPEGEHDD